MALENDVYSCIQPVLGVTTIWQDQNAKRPALPYADLKVSSFNTIAGAHYGDINNDGDQKVYNDVEFTLSINYYDHKKSVVSFLSDFANKLTMTSVLDAFTAKKLVIVDTLSASDTSFALNNAEIEKRSTIDIRLRYQSVLTDRLGIIETANITHPNGVIQVDF